MHSAWGRMFRPSEKELAKRKWEELAAQFEQKGVAAKKGRYSLIASTATQVRMALFDHVPMGSRDEAVLQLVDQLFDYDDLFRLPTIDWERNHSIADLWEFREELSRQAGLVDRFDDIVEVIEAIAIAILKSIYDACPAMLEDHDAVDGIQVPTDLLRSIGNLGEVVEQVLSTAFLEDLDKLNLFRACKLNCNTTRL